MLRDFFKEIVNKDIVATVKYKKGESWDPIRFTVCKRPWNKRNENALRKKIKTLKKIFCLNAMYKTQHQDIEPIIKNDKIIECDNL